MSNRTLLRFAYHRKGGRIPVGLKVSCQSLWNVISCVAVRRVLSMEVVEWKSFPRIAWYRRFVPSLCTVEQVLRMAQLPPMRMLGRTGYCDS
jgi:hypothetical protein